MTNAVGCMAIEMAFFYMYYMYYSKCRAWSGWAIYVFASLPLIALFSAFVTSPADEKRNWFNFPVETDGSGPHMELPPGSRP